MRNLLSLPLLFVVSCGAISGWFTASVVPDEIAAGAIELRDQVYTGNWQDEPFVIGDARRLPVPFSYADFDLQMAVELGEGAILDVLVRQVEPRVIGSELLPFHGRFSVLRLSTDRSGPPWLTREQALLGDRDRGGVDLAAGHTATVWLHGRGRWLHANVAGKWLPWFEADDVYGSFLLAARGGPAVIKSLTITPLGQSGAVLWSRWFWITMGCLLGFVVGATGIWIGASSLLVGTLLACSALVLWLVVRDGPLPLQHPPLAPLFAMLGACGCFALGAAPKRLWLVLVGIGLLLLAPPPSPDEAALDAVFGPAAGSSLSEAHIQLLRGPRMIHDLRPEQRRVFLLGGQLLYDRASPDEHLEGLLAADLAAALGIVRPRRVDVPCLPTTDGHTQQQWSMFSRFYRGYRPDVIVLGVSEFEGIEDPLTGKPRSYPGTVEGVIADAQAYCRSSGAQLVLFADDELPEQFLTVLKQAAERGIPLVVAGEGEAPASLSQRLAAAIAALIQ